MANPFLMTDDDLSPKSNDLNSNPFLMQQSQDPADDYASENPFLVQANNPFAAFGDDGGGGGEPEPTTTGYANDTGVSATMNDGQLNMFLDHGADGVTTTTTTTTATSHVDSAMSFFGTTITDMDDMDDTHAIKPIMLNINKDMLNYDDNMAYSSEDELTKVRHPPPRPVPPSKTTQDLILSVADQLDQTSSHLLGRLPVTRTPSPVSMRDLHTPSPTHDFADLLDVSDTGANIFGNDDMSSDNFMDMPAPPPALTNDNPFAVADETVPVKTEPPRPPPPRPTPPRPTPPRRPSPPSAAPSVVPVAHHHAPPPPPRPHPPVQHEPDLFDMFGSDLAATKPNQPPPQKSNQDILSLFSSPAPQQQPVAAAVSNDLLSGDFLSMDDDPGLTASLPSVMSSEVTHHPAAAPFLPPPVPQQIPHETLVPSHEDSNATALSSEVSDNEQIDNSSISPIVSDIPSQVTPHTEKENILDEIEASDYSVVDSASISDHIVNIVAASDVSDEQMDTTVDFSGVTPTPSVNPFASPEAELVADELGTAYATEPTNDIFDDTSNIQTNYATEQANDIFGDSNIQTNYAPVAAAAAVQPNDIFGVSNQSTNIPKIEKSDEFDAFAAKFDSVKKEEHSLLGDGFGAPSRSVSAEFGMFFFFYIEFNLISFSFCI